MWNIYVLFVSMLLQMFACLVPASSDQSVFDAEKVTAMLQRSLECHNTPAMAVTVVKEGKILYSKGFGYTDLDKKIPVTDDTLFNIASITKSFAAAIFVKMLNETTTLTLHSKVRDLLHDEFIMPDDLRTKETTFLDLLSHKTALYSYNRVRFDNDFNRDTLLRRLQLMTSTAQFRVDYNYNNILYGLIGKLTEVLDGSGKRWEELVDQHIFRPLNMKTSTFITRIDLSRKDYARGFRISGDSKNLVQVTSEFLKRWGEICASGSIMSTTKEMAKWMNFHLYDGKNEDNSSVMNKELVDELHTRRFLCPPQMELDIEMPKYPVTSYTTDYALGLRAGFYRGLEFLSHTGSTLGYSSYMTLLKNEKIGVITLLNRADWLNRQRGAINNFLMDLALGLKPYIDEKSICTFPRPWIKNPIKPNSVLGLPNDTAVDQLEFPINEYEGEYSNKIFGKIKIVYNSTLNSPIMTYGWAAWKLLVAPTRKNKIKNSSAKEKDLQRIFARGIAPVVPFNLEPFYFIPKSEWSRHLCW